MILSFLIVVVHCHNKNGEDIKLKTFSFTALSFYVPTFFVISFYFSFRLFISKNIIKIKQRFIRILIPYIIWPIIFWLEYNIYNFLNNRRDKYIFKNLYYQLLIGHGFYGIYWFLFDLIFVSLFFTIIILLFKKYYLSIMKIIFLLILIYDYKGFNNYIFEKFNHTVQHSIFPLPSSLFYSLSGFFLGSINILEKCQKKGIIFIYLLFISFGLIKDNQIILLKCPSLRIIIIDLGSIGLFTFFGLIPLERIKNKFIILLIKKITQYTGGIYYLHPYVMLIFQKYFKLLMYRNIKGCFLIYLVCYFICLFGSILFKKSNLKYLFV